MDCSDSKVCKYQYEIIPSGADLDKECDVYPACYIFNTKYFHVVGSSEGSINRWGGIDNYGNYGSRVQFLEPGTMRGTPEMTGTSQSTAIHTGKWAAGLIP